MREGARGRRARPRAAHNGRRSLYPVVYFDRYQRAEARQPGSGDPQDLDMLVKVVERYILPFPYRLPDGTFARTAGWPGAPSTGNASFLWGDDQCVARAARPAEPPAACARACVRVCVPAGASR